MSGVMERTSAALVGERLVRLFYIDESGRSDLVRDPQFVVAGIGIHGDSQYRNIVSYLTTLKNKCFPSGAPDGFYFHATELYSGGKFFPRDSWPWEKREPVLMLLAQIPATFDLPVFISCLDRKKFRDAVGAGEFTEQDFRHVEHTICLAHCEVAMDQWLGEFAPNELAMMFAEDVPDVKRSLKSIHLSLRHEHAKEDPRFEPVKAHVPITRIIDTLSFAEKSESPLLQIADLCTFLAKRRLALDTRIMRSFEVLEPKIADWSQWSPA